MNNHKIWHNSNHIFNHIFTLCCSSGWQLLGFVSDTGVSVEQAVTLNALWALLLLSPIVVWYPVQMRTCMELDPGSFWSMKLEIQDMVSCQNRNLLVHFCLQVCLLLLPTYWTMKSSCRCPVWWLGVSSLVGSCQYLIKGPAISPSYPCGQEFLCSYAKIIRDVIDKSHL